MTRMAAICHESVIRLSPAGFDESCMRSRRRPQPRRRRQRSGCDATSRGAARWRCSRSNGLATSTMLAELEVHSVSRATLHLCRWDLSRMFVSGSAAVWCHRCRIRGRRNGARRPAAGRALLAAFRRSRAGCAVSAFGHDPSRWPLGRPRRSARHAVAGAQARARKPAPHHRSGRSRTGAIQRITSPGRRRETTLRRSQRYERSLTEVRSLRVASRRGAGPAARSRCAGGDDTDARQRWTLRSWGKGEGTFG